MRGDGFMSHTAAQTEKLIPRHFAANAWDNTFVPGNWYYAKRISAASGSGCPSYDH